MSGNCSDYWGKENGKSGGLEAFSRAIRDMVVIIHKYGAYIVA